MNDDACYNRSHKWQCAAPRKYGTQQQGGSHKAGELKKLVDETGSNNSAKAFLCAYVVRRLRQSRSEACGARSHPAKSCAPAHIHARPTPQRSTGHSPVPRLTGRSSFK